MSEIMDNSKEKMEKALASLQSNLNALRAGRANPGMLDRVIVDYYGAKTPLPQMATISSPEPRMLTVQPWDQSAMESIEKAIQASNIGINPSNDGKMIRLVIPQLTQERREELCKSVQKEGENAKVAVRNIRRSSMQDLKALEKNHEITEDDLKGEEKDLQKLTDDYIKKIDEKIKNKEKEITTI